MLSPPLNVHVDTTAQYDELAAALAARYGPSAQAVVFLLYEELLRLRTILAADPGAGVVAARIAGLRGQIQQLYSLSVFPALESPPVRLVSEDPIIIEFDRERFQQRYAAVAATMRAEVVTVAGPALGPLRGGTPYMFVIDDERRLRVWNRAFSFDDLVFGRNRATVDGVPVGHPMLVPERLRVMAAGELVFIGDQPAAAGGDRHAVAAVVNTKSGHFRPPPSTVGVIRAVLSTVVGLGDRDVDVFAIEQEEQ